MKNSVIKIFSFYCLLLLHNLFRHKSRLPRLVRDSMILQRDTKIKIWGWAAKSEKVKIKFNGKNYKTTTGSDGKWMIQLPPMKAGGPYTMEITGKQ